MITFKRFQAELLTVVCVAVLLSAGTVRAEESASPEDVEISMELTNRTGKDIISFTVKDISSYPNEDFSEELANQGLINEGEVFAADQTMVLEYITVEQQEQSDPPVISEELMKLQDLLRSCSFESDFLAAFQLAEDESQVYVLHVFKPEEAYHTELFLEDGIAWLEYSVKDSDEVLSTREAEQAIHDMETKAPESREDSGNTAEAEPEIVSQVAFPNCDDESHGYYEITYSDGSVEYVEY